MPRFTPLGLLAVLAAGSAHAQSAGKLYNQGRAAETRDDIDGAYTDYARAFQKKPGNLQYKISYERLRLDAAAAHVKHGERLRDQGDYTGALTEFLRALEIDPSNELASQDIRVTREKVDGEGSQPALESATSPSARKEMQSLSGVPELKPLSNEPLTLHMMEDSKVVYQTIGKTAGINVLFDPEYQSKRVSLDLANTNLFDALRILGTVSGTFWRPITDNTIFVAQNTRGKRAELDEQAVQTFYLTNVAQQNDLNDIQTGLRNVFTTAKLYGIPSQNAIIMRGTPDELLLAGKLIGDLDKARPEVVVDIAILEVSRALTRTLGIQLPQTASINFQQSNALTGTTTATTTTPTTNGQPATANGSALQLNQLAHINSTNFAVTIGQASVNLMLSDASTKLIQNPRLRATDGQESIVRIGQRIPVATGSFQAGVGAGVTNSLVNTQFQYLDVGVNVDMKPTVHYDRDVSMKLKIEVSSEGPQQNLGGVNNPIINQRVSEQTIRLREGESTILSGILQHQTSRSVSGYPGLAELPILRYVFGSTTDSKTDDEVVFLLTPHIVRAAFISPLNLRQVDTGTTNDIQLRHVNAIGDDTQSSGDPNIGAPRPQLPGASNPTQLPPGTIPGQVVPPGALTPPPPPPDANQQIGPPSAAIPQTIGAAPPVQLQLQSSNPTQAVGNTFQEKVMLTGGQDVYSVPLQLTYDQSKLQLVNVDTGDLLGKDGQAVALAHRDDNGTVAISTSRPPGVAGINGDGLLCTLTFQAKAPGDAKVEITRPVVRNSKQQALPATGSQASIHIQ